MAASQGFGKHYKPKIMQPPAVCLGLLHQNHLSCLHSFFNLGGECGMDISPPAPLEVAALHQQYQWCIVSLADIAFIGYFQS